MSVRLTQEGNCSWCGSSNHGENGWCPHDHFTNTPTTARERSILENLMRMDDAALRYNKKLRDIPGAVAEAAKLGISL